MKPLVSYYGGKQRLACKIVPLLPRHTVYVEPFAGGAAIFFAKPWPPATNNDHYREVLNDIDQQIVNLYQVIRTPGLRESFIERLHLTPYARIEYRAALRHMGAKVRPAQDPAQDLYDGLDPRVADAVAYYFNIQCSFSNKLSGGWGTSVFSRNLGATWANKVTRLPEYLDRMSGVHLECDDANAVIKRWDSPQTLFYCDPPYPGTHQGHYEGYTQQDFASLCETLDNAAGSFVLSNYAQDCVPSHWERFEFEARSSSAKVSGSDRTRANPRQDTTRKEVVWRVDRSQTARNEIQQIWNKWGWQQGQPMPGK